MASLNVESERTPRRAGEREEAVPNVLAEALITLTAGSFGCLGCEAE